MNSSPHFAQVLATVADQDEVERLAELARRFQNPRLCHCPDPTSQVDEDLGRQCVTCGKPLDPPRTLEQIEAEEAAERERDRQLALRSKDE